MKIIEGYEAAKGALKRGSPGVAYHVSPQLKASLDKLFGTEDPEQAVREIGSRLRQSGDAALREFTLSIDGIKLEKLEVGQDEIEAAYRQVDAKLISAMQFAAERIRAFHEAQKKAIWHETSLAGLRQLIRPLERVGVYAPGGTAAYPSTVLMTAIPAKVAGVPETVLATPPGPNGVPPAVLAAARIAGVDRVFSIGGAQAIFALAYGTQSVPKVDKVCGPGNIFVMLAKKQVFGIVGIDGLQGPSEVLVIADETSNAAYCASDLLAQAEHDALAGIVLVTTSRELIVRVQAELDKQLAQLSRREIVRQPLDHGIIALVKNPDEAVDLANLYAPEHLCIISRQAASYVDKVRNAGCIVAGEKATVVLGDYVAGPSHALPTGGTARFSSPLSVADFIKFISVIVEDEAMVRSLGTAAALMARAEGLDAHARAIEKRLE